MSPIPYHKASLADIVQEYEAEECAASQVTPPYLNNFVVGLDHKIILTAKISRSMVHRKIARVCCICAVTSAQQE